jgi:hypothetical protein
MLLWQSSVQLTSAVHNCCALHGTMVCYHFLSADSSCSAPPKLETALPPAAAGGCNAAAGDGSSSGTAQQQGNALVVYL